MSAGSIDAFWEKYGGDCLDSDDDFPDFVLKKPSASALGKRRLLSPSQHENGEVVSDESPRSSPESPSLISPTVYDDLHPGEPKVPRYETVVLTDSEETTCRSDVGEDADDADVPELVIDECPDAEDKNCEDVKLECYSGDMSDSQVFAAAEALTKDINWIQKAEKLFPGHDTEFDGMGIFFDAGGKLCMEVGIERELCFSYNGGDNVQVRRCISRVGAPRDQHLPIPVHRWMRLTDSLYSMKLVIQELFAGNPVELKLHVGGLLMLHISSRYQCVHLRQYCIPINQRLIKATEHGVVLSISEFAYMVNLFECFTSEISKFSRMTPCYLLPGHSESCLECYPIKFPKPRKTAGCLGGGLGFMKYPLQTRFEST